jgi:hypothetical protein
MAKGPNWAQVGPKVSAAPVVVGTPGVFAVQLIGVVIARPGQLALKPLEIGLR